MPLLASLINIWEIYSNDFCKKVARSLNPWSTFDKYILIIYAKSSQLFHCSQHLKQQMCSYDFFKTNSNLYRLWILYQRWQRYSNHLSKKQLVMLLSKFDKYVLMDWKWQRKFLPFFVFWWTFENYILAIFTKIGQFFAAFSTLYQHLTKDIFIIYAKSI